MRFPQIPRFGLCAALAVMLPGQMRIGSDELSLHAAPYTPLSSPGVIRTQVGLVEVPVVVRDSKSNAIPDLRKDDFEVFDAGKRQQISTFSVETSAHNGTAPNAPHDAATPPATALAKPEVRQCYIALVLDDLNTDFGSLRRGKTAAEKFVSESLVPGDLVGIFTTALSQTVEFTADAQKLHKAIEAVAPHARYSDDLYTCPVIRAYEAYLIANHLDLDLLKAKAAEAAQCLHFSSMDSAMRLAEAKADAVWRNASANTNNTLYSIASIVSAMKELPGQRLVLLTTSGFVTGGAEPELQQLSTLALRSGVVISAMDLRGLYTIIPGGDAATPTWARGMHPAELRVQTRVEDSKDDGLAVLTTATGGRFFHNNNGLEDGFRLLGAVPEVFYVLGFAPGDVVHDGKYHPLKVRLTNGLHGDIEARTGYYAPRKETPAELEGPQQRDRILIGTESPADIAVRLEAEPAASDTGPKIAAKVWIDVSRLNFENRKDRRNQKLTVIAALFDGSRNFVVGRRADATLALKQNSYQALSAAGLTIALSLHAPPGAYNLRVLVQEELTGKTTALSRGIELR